MLFSSIGEGVYYLVFKGDLIYICMLINVVVLGLNLYVLNYVDFVIYCC